jgi:hypothetical protein
MSDIFPSPAVQLDDLLAGIARGLAAAQRNLDAVARATDDMSADGVHLRPLWFVFERTTLELELSTFTVTNRGTQFECRPLDPVALALRGDARTLGARIRVEIAPLGAQTLRRDEGQEP